MNTKDTIRISKEKIEEVFFWLEIDNTLSKIRLGELTGMTRQSVHRAIKSLIDDKRIKDNGKKETVTVYEIIKKD